MKKEATKIAKSLILKAAAKAHPLGLPKKTKLLALDKKDHGISTSNLMVGESNLDKSTPLYKELTEINKEKQAEKKIVSEPSILDLS